MLNDGWSTFSGNRMHQSSIFIVTAKSVNTVHVIFLLWFSFFIPIKFIRSSSRLFPLWKCVPTWAAFQLGKNRHSLFNFSYPK